MPVDTSSYPQPQPAPNFAQTLGSVAGTIGQLNQNKLFGQQYQTNLATSQIYKEAMNPDGSIDQGKLTNLLQSNPSAAYGIGPVLEQSQQIQHQNIANQQAKYDLLKNHLTTLAGYLGPLASGNPTVNDVAATIGHAISTGVATPQEAANFWSTLPRDQQGNPDPTQIKSWAQDNLQRVQTAAEQYGITNPAPVQVNTGGQTHLTVMPQNGPIHDVGKIDNTLPPMATRQNININHGAPMAIGPITSELQVPGQTASQAQASALAGSMPGLSGNGGGNTQPSPATAAPSGMVQTGLAPGEAEAQQHQAVAGADQGVTLQKAADTVPQQKAILGNLEAALRNFTSGPGADWRKVAGALANTPLQAVGFSGFNAKSIASQEEFVKQATNLAQSQFATLGGTGTDAKLESTMHTSPNETLSKQGNQNIINLLKGNADAIAVKNQEWQKFQQQSGNGPGDYGKFSTQFNTEYDPRVFQSQYMGAADRASMLKGMTKGEQKQFRQSYNLAVEKGWIPDPRQANAGQ